jgi:hypothetical protein
MKVLLDECVDWRLARELEGHEVKAARQMGWATISRLPLSCCGPGPIAWQISGRSFRTCLPPCLTRDPVLRPSSNYSAVDGGRPRDSSMALSDRCLTGNFRIGAVSA